VGKAWLMSGGGPLVIDPVEALGGLFGKPVRVRIPVSIVDGRVKVG
jgi:hypothetical protein